MGDFEKALPSAIVDLATTTPSGSELVIPLDDANRAVSIANQNLIAVLGVEIFRVLDNGLGVETYSGYDFDLRGNWEDFARLNNDAALRFIQENPFGEGYGYILTAVSKDEFRRLQNRADGS
jgi:hypothetical protein